VAQRADYFRRAGEAKDRPATDHEPIGEIIFFPQGFQVGSEGGLGESISGSRPISDGCPNQQII
jgi:hypothetical protein